MKQLFCIIPCYNSASTIERTLSSINAAFDAWQENKEWRLVIVVVDDGSTDQTVSVVSHFPCPLAEISLLAQPHRGVAFARNLALDHIFGPTYQKAAESYVFFVDSDDELFLNFFSSLVVIGKESITCGIYATSNKERPTVTYAQAESLVPIEALKAMLQYSLLPLRSGCVNKIYPLSACRDVRFPGINYCEDLVFNYWVFKRVQSIVLVRDVTYLVHRNGKTLTSKPFDRQKAEQWVESLLVIEAQIGCDPFLRDETNQLECGYLLEILQHCRFSTARKAINGIGQRKTVRAYRPSKLKERIKKTIYLVAGGMAFWLLSSFFGKFRRFIRRSRSFRIHPRCV